MAQIITLTFMNLITPKAGAEREPLFNKMVSGLNWSKI
jgi:hypothetical protein